MKKNRKILGYGILSAFAIATTVAVPVVLTVNYDSLNNKVKLSNDLLVSIWDEVEKQVSSLTNLNDVNSIQSTLVDKINEILKNSGIYDANVTSVNIILSPSIDGTTQIAKPVTINFSNNITGESEYFDINSNELISKNPIQTGILNNETPNGFDLSSVSTNIWDVINSVVNQEWTDINEKTQLQQDLVNKINEITQPLGVTVKSVDINLENGDTHKIAMPILIEFNEQIVGNFGNNFSSTSNSLTTLPPIETGIFNNMTTDGLDLSSINAQIYEKITAVVNSNWTDINDETSIETGLVNSINTIVEPLGGKVASVNIELVNGPTYKDAMPITITFEQTITGTYENFIANQNTLVTKNAIQTGIEYIITEEAINTFKNSFLNINIDNYKEYFENANNLPESQNSGHMNATTINKLSNGLIPINAILSIDFQKSGNTDDGFLNLNIVINLNNPYIYNNSATIVISNFTTKIYDPNSNFNKSLFINSNGTFNGITELGKQQEKLYFPNDMVYAAFPNNGFRTALTKVLNFSFATQFRNFNTNNAQFQNNSSIEQIIFDNPNFNTFNGRAWMFGSCSNLTSVIFKNCVSLNEISIKCFQGDTKITNLDFSECINLRNILEKAFQNCSSLIEIDLSGSTLEIVNDDVFIGCTSLQTIYVKDEASLNIINNSINAAGLSNVNVVIK